MATSKKPEKEPDKVPDKDAIKEEAKDFQHGLDVSPSMPYYCTWLPGACPEGDEGVGDSPFTRPPLCPPPGAGPATIVPTFVPPCPTMPMVCVPTFNPQCPKQDAVEGHANAIAQTRTIITCTGIPIVCGQHEQAQTLLPTTTVYTIPLCPPTVNPVATCIPNTTDCPEGQVAGVSAPPNCPTVQQCPPTWNCGGAQAQTFTATTTVQTANTHCFICPPQTVAQAQAVGGVGQSVIYINCPTQHGPATVCVTAPVNTLYSAPPNCPTVQQCPPTWNCATQPQAAGTIGQSAIILNCPTQHGPATVCGTGPVNTLYSAPPNCPTVQQCPPTWNCGTQPQAQITLLSAPAVCPTIHTHCYICPPGDTAQAQTAGTIGHSVIRLNCPTQHGPATVCTPQPQALLTAPPNCGGIQTNVGTIGQTGWYGCFPSGTATTTVNPCGTGTQPQALLTAPPNCGGIQTNACTIGPTGWQGCFPSGTATTTVNPCGTGTKPQITLLTAPPNCGGIQTNVCPPGITGWHGCFPSGTATTTVNPCGTGTKPQITLLTAPPNCGGIQTNVCPPGITGWHGCFPSGTATTTVNPCGTGTKPQITLLTAPPNCGGIYTNVCPPGITGWYTCTQAGTGPQPQAVGDTWNNATCPTKGNPTCPGGPQITLLTAPPACTGIPTNACTIGQTGWYTCTQTGTGPQPQGVGDTWNNATCPTKGNPTCPGGPQITLLTAPPACTGIPTNACTIGQTGWYTCTQTGTGPQPAAITVATVCTQGGTVHDTLFTQPFGQCPVGTNATVCTQFGCPQPTITNPVATCPITTVQGGAQAQTAIRTFPAICNMTGPGQCPPSFGCPGGIGAKAQAVPQPTTTTTFPPICGGITRNATVCTIATTCTQIATCPGGAAQAQVPHCYTVANCGNTYATVCTMSPQCTQHPAIPDGNQGAQAQTVSGLRPSICCTHAHEVCITAAPQAQWTLPNTTCGIGPVTTTDPGTIPQVANANMTFAQTNCGIGPVQPPRTLATVCTQIGCPQITLVTYQGCIGGGGTQPQAQVQWSRIPAICGIVPFTMAPPCVTQGTTLPPTNMPGCPVPTTFTQLGCRTVGVACPNTAPDTYAGCTAQAQTLLTTTTLITTVIR
ncbi:MAG: hypothetical protein P1U56_09100 [Saprospiraceae bacterium]|nr:hypothetical protein [Saprospiraceae bacterium]